ncbi:mitogen-activated protein kinase-binding protein 1 [Ostrinia furnacalis]|uniref:mitogen-activated protein kinase-binding protein 1 n=1 Tax=Ostrinia furnacalis TaxID=93504 RepID=UPI001039C579|nr:mitogen-activated protein kinase-binding protein 1 [Ostrinia furnacalis]
MEAGFIPAGAGGAAGSAAPPAVVAPPANVIRAPGLKRGKLEEAISDRIKLESVLGLTVGSNAALDCDPNTEVVAYPAGCTVVLYNVRKNRQSHVLNASRKSVTCVAFSPDGRFLATGECGHAPAVRVWDLQDPTASGAVQIGEFPGHTHGVSCVAFSTSSKYLVSVGSQHDMIVNVWDWRANLKLASNKVSSRVKAVSFSESGNYFVTVGFRHVKFWYLEYSRSAKFKEPVPLMGRSAILGEQKDNEFCDVVCGRGAASDSTYAITRGGLLCEFNSRRLLDKWVELRTSSANCMAIGSNYIFVGCAEGIVRVFAPDSLRYVTTLPRTHYLGVDVAQGTNISHMFNQPPNARYPDAVALTYDERNHKLTCVYNDHSLYVWDVRDIKRVGKSHSALYHSACIWGVDMAGGTPHPPGTFLTCSSDDTVRAWRLHPPQPPNIYTNELCKVLYIDPELKFLKDVDLTATNEKDKAKSYDDKTGVRCVRVSPDGQHIASGDRAGNIWVHSASGALLRTLEAHDAEVLCLEYAASPRLLASASRDRLIHVFRADQGYQILQTLDEHSSSITAVRFLNAGGGLQMVSCGADKTILFRQLRTTSDGSYQFARGQNVSGRTTLYDMEVDAGGRHILTACQDRNVRVYSAVQGRHTKTFRGTTAEDGTLIKVALDNSGIYLATSSTDKILSVYDYYSGECMATMYGHSEIVTGLKFTPDCQHLVSASGDGCIFVWRVPHDMVVTMRARLAQQAIRQGKKVPASNGMSGLESESESHLGSPPRELPYEEKQFTTPVVPDYTLRIGRLPSWAKKSLGDELVAPETPAPDPPARGKWATRIHPTAEKRDSDGSKDSSLDSGTDTRYIEKRQQSAKQRPKSLNLSQLPRVEALFRHFDATMRKTYDILTISPRVEKVTINLSKTRTTESRTRHHTDDSSLGSFKYEDQESTEHDGDIEDISDGERTSSSERGNRTMYYPGNNDEDTPGEFMVNAMDAEELRQSVRRSKRWQATGSPRLELPPGGTSLSGSGHDSDDDEVSTPSGDNAERNPLSGSCESLDTAGRREKYIKSAYDSLCADGDNDHNIGNNSLSSQHLSRAPPAPARAAPSPAPRTPSKTQDPEAARRREELHRRILETRRQLESVAFRSNLKSSQSTHDLSYIPEKDGSKRARPVSMAVPSNTRPYGERPHVNPSSIAASRQTSEEEESSGMRRAISLSDLAVKPMPAPRTPQASSKPAQPSPGSNKSPSGFARPAPRYNGKSNMTRSSSVGVLNNQSDSESDPQPSRPQASSRTQGLMRPTISSMNKAAANTARRRGLANAYSSVSLSTGGQEESSSEAEERGAEKPAVPPRPRAGSVDHTQRRIGRSGSERDLSAKAREVTARLTSNTRQSRPPKQESTPDANLSSSQLCSALTEQLTKTACKVVQLYASLQREPGAAADISGLEAAILETQKVLKSAVSRQTQNGDALSSLSSTEGDCRPNVDSTRKKLENLVSKEANNAGNPAMSLIEQYSDILLNMMQSKMVNQFSQSPQSLPPNARDGADS